MKTVNEIAFGSKRFPVKDYKASKFGVDCQYIRPREFQEPLLEAYQAASKELPDTWRTAKKNMDVYRIPNLGDTAISEILGCLGVFLSQFSDEQAELLTHERRKRDWFIPARVRKQTL